MNLSTLNEGNGTTSNVTFSYYWEWRIHVSGQICGHTLIRLVELCCNVDCSFLNDAFKFFTLCIYRNSQTLLQRERYSILGSALKHQKTALSSPLYAPFIMAIIM